MASAIAFASALSPRYTPLLPVVTSFSPTATVSPTPTTPNEPLIPVTRPAIRLFALTGRNDLPSRPAQHRRNASQSPCHTIMLIHSPEPFCLPRYDSSSPRFPREKRKKKSKSKTTQTNVAWPNFRRCPTQFNANSITINLADIATPAQATTVTARRSPSFLSRPLTRTLLALLSAMSSPKLP
jgi:hypothetical protein